MFMEEKNLIARIDSIVLSVCYALNQKINSHNMFQEFMKGKTLKLFKMSSQNMMNGHHMPKKVKRKVEMKNLLVQYVSKVWGQKLLSKDTCIIFMRKTQVLVLKRIQKCILKRFMKE